ncbi:hypothetical protein [Rhizobium sp.]|uniref:hypothetical protein n=1 Tax=Rhizobium sp. TaxID=391 RepID=UPI002AA91AE6
MELGVICISNDFDNCRPNSLFSKARHPPLRLVKGALMPFFQANVYFVINNDIFGTFKAYVKLIFNTLHATPCLARCAQLL